MKDNVILFSNDINDSFAISQTADMFVLRSYFT